MQFKPTWLYIKQHKITGLKYLGKTTGNVWTYSGSGKYWKNHLAVHGNEVITVWAQLFSDKTSLVETARQLSEQYNIVKSELWANLKPENGTDGGPNEQGPWNKGKKGLQVAWNKGIVGAQTAWNKGLPPERQPKFGKPGYWKGKSTWNKGIVGAQTAWNKSITGPANPLFGKSRPPRDDVWAKKISEATKGKPKVRKIVTCPHCNKQGNQSPMKRWHFDNCKLNQPGSLVVS